MSLERWRDAGDGMIECEVTKRRARLIDVRTLPNESTHTIQFTPKQWAKLEALAAARSTPKHTYTPAECVHAFVATCLPGGSGWKAPGS